MIKAEKRTFKLTKRFDILKFDLPTPSLRHDFNRNFFGHQPSSFWHKFIFEIHSERKSTESKLIYSFPLKQRSTLLQISHKLQESNEIENKTCLTLFFLISYYYVFYAKIGHFPAWYFPTSSLQNRCNENCTNSIEFHCVFDPIMLMQKLKIPFDRKKCFRAFGQQLKCNKKSSCQISFQHFQRKQFVIESSVALKSTPLFLPTIIAVIFSMESLEQFVCEKKSCLKYL